MTDNQRPITTQRVIDMLDAQNAKGVAKYGTTIDEAQDGSYDWRIMAMEEMIDGLQYQQKEIMRLESELVAEKETSALLAKQLADEVQEHAKTIAMGQRNVAVLTDQLQEMIDLKAVSDTAMSKAVIAAAELLEEVETLRTDLNTSENQYKVLAEEKAEVEELLQQAEQELAEQSRQWLLEKGLKNQAEQQRDEWVVAFWKEHEANTAMREAITALKKEYLDEDFLNGPDGESDATVGYRLAYKRICEVLSRYPKEGGNAEG